MKRSILLADDSVTIQKVIELTFMDEDYEVRAVSNGDEAVALLSEAYPEFVIADVHMPGSNGYEVCRRAKQLRPERPVLLLVGTFEPFDEAQARAAGADSFLKKPFDSQELLLRVGELLARQPAPAPPPAAGFAAPAPAPELPLTQTEAIPEFAAEPAWGNLEVEAELEPAFAEPEPAFAAPESAFAASEPALESAPAFAAPEPFDREPSFELPEPSFAMEAEPVFTLEESEPSLSFQEDVFQAPGELALEEAPYDPYLPEEPAPPAPGYGWAAEEVPAPEPAFPAAAAPPPAAAEPAPANGGGRLSDEDVDRIARRVVELLGDKPVREVAWEVVPDLAEVIIRDRLRELEAQVE